MRTRAARVSGRHSTAETTHLGLFCVCGVVLVCPGGGDHPVPGGVACCLVHHVEIGIWTSHAAMVT